VPIKAELSESNLRWQFSTFEPDRLRAISAKNKGSWPQLWSPIRRRYYASCITIKVNEEGRHMQGPEKQRRRYTNIYGKGTTKWALTKRILGTFWNLHEARSYGDLELRGPRGLDGAISTKVCLEVWKGAWVKRGKTHGEHRRYAKHAKRIWFRCISSVCCETNQPTKGGRETLNCMSFLEE